VSEANPLQQSMSKENKLVLPGLEECFAFSVGQVNRLHSKEVRICSYLAPTELMSRNTFIAASDPVNMSAAIMEREVYSTH